MQSIGVAMFVACVDMRMCTFVRAYGCVRLFTTTYKSALGQVYDIFKYYSSLTIRSRTRRHMNSPGSNSTTACACKNNGAMFFIIAMKTIQTAHQQQRHTTRAVSKDISADEKVTLIKKKLPLLD